VKAHNLILLILLFVGIANHYSFAQPTIVQEPSELQLVSDSGPQYAMPSSTRDTLFTTDSIIVIHTVCAPICSSCARVYNKEWQLIGVLKPDFKSAFPYATIQAGKVIWQDNDTLDYTPAQ
jgi:hypothetical protein